VDVKVPFLREHLPTTAFWAVEEVQSFVFRPLVELKPRKPSKSFAALRPLALVALGLLVSFFVVLAMLAELEGFPAVKILATEVSGGQLY